MRALWLTVLLVGLMAIACGGGDSATVTPGTSSEATDAVETTTTGTPTDDLCPLLPAADVLRTTGYDLLEAQPHNADPFHFCTLYLDIPDCNMQCALSLEYLGPVDPNNFNSPDAFRESLKGANPDANFAFRDGAFGPDSWLATAQAGQLPQWKVVYFQVNGVALDLHSPLVAEYVLTEQQVIDVTNAVIGHLNQ